MIKKTLHIDHIPPFGPRCTRASIGMFGKLQTRLPRWKPSGLSRGVLATLIFLTVFCTLGLPFKQWGCLWNDEFSYLSIGPQANSIKDLAHFFVKGDGRQHFAENKKNTSATYFDVQYRPLYFKFATLQHWAFGQNVYYHHLTDVGVHALNATLIFLLASSFTTTGPALLGSLYFAFHPIIAYDPMRIDYLHIFISLFFMLLLALCFKKFLDSRKRLYYMLSLFLYMLALLTRETGLVLAPIIFIGSLLYLHSKQPTQPFSWRSCILFAAPFKALAIMYIALKFFLYPNNLVSASHTWNTLILKNIKERFTLRLLSLVYDGIGLSWLLYAQSIVRIATLGTYCVSAAFLFFKNTQKLIVLFLGCSALLMLWPCFTLAGYVQRYLYEPLPLIIFFFMALWTGAKDKLPYILKKITFPIICCIVLGQAALCFNEFSKQEHRAIIVSKAINSLVHSPKLTGRALCFYGIPQSITLGNHYFLRVIDLYRKDAGPVFENIKDQLPVDPEILKLNPLFITWDYENQLFMLQETIP